MNDTSGSLITQLFSIRNRYGKDFSSQKLKLFVALDKEPVKNKKAAELYYSTLLFLLAYPDNSAIYNHACRSLQRLQDHIQSHQSLKNGLYNSGITRTQLCAAFSFEIIKWLRNQYRDDIRLSSIDANEGQIQSILSAVMPKVESEILQDGNANWKSWIRLTKNEKEDVLDRLIAIFDETDIRPEVKDELWGALGVNAEIDFSSHSCLPASLVDPFYHRSLIRKNFIRQSHDIKPVRVQLDKTEAEQIIDCSRMALVRHLREIDPISFTAAPLVSFYRLQRGLSVALMGMVPDRRHPIDSYIGYVVFKNGLPVAYAASWILFDSGRIGLNIFPAYRGGESQYIFDQVLKLHSKVYRLKRFSVDPYQLGKDNSDGIQSGAFWVYYHTGFRPMKNEQKQLAETEAQKIKTTPGYRSPSPVLKKLSDSRMELLLQKSATRFDATDLSLAYARLLKEKFNNNRNPAEKLFFTRLAKLLQIKDPQEEKMQFILKNWCILLSGAEQGLRLSGRNRATLKKLFRLKATGLEEDYITGLQRARELRTLLESILEKYTE